MIKNGVVCGKNGERDFVKCQHLKASKLHYCQKKNGRGTLRIAGQSKEPRGNFGSKIRKN